MQQFRASLSPSTPPLPTLTEHRLLPAGVHDCTLDQLEALFGRFQRSERRPRLFSRLREYIAELRSTGWTVQLVIDGSFVMPPVDEPGDIDIILVMPESWDIQCELRPFEYNLLSKKRARSKFGFDVFVVRSGSEEELEMVGFFQGIKEDRCRELGVPVTLTKGIVRIVP